MRDDVRTASEQSQSAQSLIGTERVDAVNSGLVASASPSPISSGGGTSALGLDTDSNKRAAAANLVSNVRHDAVHTGIVTSMSKASHVGNVARSAATDVASKLDSGTEVEGLGDATDEALSVAVATGHGAKDAYSSTARAAKAIRRRMANGKSAKRHTVDKDSFAAPTGVLRNGSRAIAGAGLSLTDQITSGTEMDGLGDTTSKAATVVVTSGKVARKAPQRIGQAQQYARKMSYSLNSVRPRTLANALKSFKESAIHSFRVNLVNTLRPLILPIIVVLASLALIAGGGMAVLSAFSSAAQQSQQNSAAITNAPYPWMTYDFIEKLYDLHDKRGYPVGAMLAQFAREIGDEQIHVNHNNYGCITVRGDDATKVVNGKTVPVRNGSFSSWDGWQTDTYSSYASVDDFLLAYDHFIQTKVSHASAYGDAVKNNDPYKYFTALEKGGYNGYPYHIWLTETYDSDPFYAAINGMSRQEFEAAYGFGADGLITGTAWQQKIVESAMKTQGSTNMCLKYVNDTYESAGYPWQRVANANDTITNGLVYQAKDYTDGATLSPGQVIVFQYGCGTYYKSGHIAIYLGNGRVRDNTCSAGETKELKSWMEYRKSNARANGWIKYGWPSSVRKYVDAASANVATGNAAAAIAKAKTMIGVPYVFGAMSPTGVDCSGLVCYCYGASAHGTTLTLRDATMRAGKMKTSLSQVQPGDIIWMNSPTLGAWRHVGIYIGNGQMIHAPQPNTKVTIRNIDDWVRGSFVGCGPYCGF